MSAKAVFIFCAQALLFQSAFSQYISRAADTFGIGAFGWGSIAPRFGYDGLAAPYGYGYNGIAAPYAYNRPAAPYAYNGIASPWDYEAAYAYDGLTGWAGLGYESMYPSIAAAIEFTPTTSGALKVTSSSAVPPTGITVVSQTGYDGILAVGGEAPFVGTTGMEGVLPTIGSGAINHACGNVINAMVSDITVFAPSYAAAAIAPGISIATSWAPATTLGYSSGLIY